MGKQWCHGGPDPYHGWGVLIDRAPYPTTPGTPPTMPAPRSRWHHAWQYTQQPGPVHQASSGYSQEPRIPTCLKLAFSSGQKTDLSKTSILLKKAYLILIVFNENGIFDVFAEFGHFLVTFLDTTGLLVFTVFHCFRVLRFPNGILRKVLNLVIFLKKHEKQ